MTENGSVRFIRLPEVRKTTGMTTSQVYRMQAAGNFPHSVKLGLSTAAWVESEVQAWCRERIEASRPSLYETKDRQRTNSSPYSYLMCTFCHGSGVGVNGKACPLNHPLYTNT